MWDIYVASGLRSRWPQPNCLPLAQSVVATGRRCTCRDASANCRPTTLYRITYDLDMQIHLQSTHYDTVNVAEVLTNAN